MFLYQSICYSEPAHVADSLMSLVWFPDGFQPAYYSIDVNNVITFTDSFASTRSIEAVEVVDVCPFEGPYSYLPSSFVDDAYSVTWLIVGCWIGALCVNLIRRALT